MRWKALYILLPLILLFGLGYYLFIDLILEKTIEASLETAIGAKVEVDKLHFSITTPSLTIGRLQITNPRNTWRNLIETKDIQFKLAWEPLFSGKIVIAKILLSELMVDTPRKTNGKLKRPPLPGPLGKAQTKLNNAIASVPIFNSNSMQAEIGQNKDKLLATYQFKTQIDAETIKTKLAESNQKWRRDLDNLAKTKQELQGVDSKLQALKTAQIKSLPDLNAALASVNDLKESITNTQTEISTTQNGFQSELAGLTLAINQLAATADQDYHNLLKMAKIPDFKSINFSEILLGRMLVNQSAIFVDLVDKLQAFMPPPTSNPPKEKHPRKGQDIIFSGRRTYPNFLIEYLSISARDTHAIQTSGYYAKGTVTGITSDPPIYGQPMLIDLSGKAPGNLYLALQGSLNHISKNIDDRLSLQVGNLSLPALRIPEQPYLPRTITVGNLAIRSNLLIKSDDFQLDVAIDGKNMAWNFAESPAAGVTQASNDLMVDVIKQTLARTDQATINYRLEGHHKKLSVSISSNLDQIFFDRFNAVIGEKFAKFTGEIKTQVEQKLREKQQELELLKNNYQRELSTQLQQLQTLANKETRTVEAKKKALEQKIRNQVNQQLNHETDKSKKDLEDQLNQLKNQLIP